MSQPGRLTHDPQLMVHPVPTDWRVEWVDCWDDETGYVLVLDYMDGQERIAYELPPDTTELIVPSDDRPPATTQPACEARNDLRITLQLRRTDVLEEVDSVVLLGLCR